MTVTQFNPVKQLLFCFLICWAKQVDEHFPAKKVHLWEFEQKTDLIWQLVDLPQKFADWQ